MFDCICAVQRGSLLYISCGLSAVRINEELLLLLSSSSTGIFRVAQIVDTIASTTVLEGMKLLGKESVIQSNSFIAAAEQVRLEPVLEHCQRRS